MRATIVIAGAAVLTVGCGTTTAPVPPPSPPPAQSSSPPAQSSSPSESTYSPSEEATPAAATAAWIDRAASTIRLCEGGLTGTQPEGVCQESVSRLVDDATLTGNIPESLLVDARTINVKMNAMAAVGGASARVDVQQAIDAFSTDLAAFKANPSAADAGATTAPSVSTSTLEGAYVEPENPPYRTQYRYVAIDGGTIRIATFLGPAQPGSSNIDPPGLVFDCFVGTISSQTAKGLAVEGTSTSITLGEHQKFRYPISGNILVTDAKTVTDPEGQTLTRVTVPANRLTYMKDSANQCPNSVGTTP